MKIKACQFNDSYFPIMDGVGMTAHNYAYWLEKKYGASAVVAPKVKGYKDRVDYKVFRFKSVLLPGMNPYRIGLPMIDFTFKKSLAKQPFDILHAHCPFISGHLALKMAKKEGIPIVSTFHTKYREDFKKSVSSETIVDFLMDMTLDFYSSVDFVWVPNRTTGETLKEYGYEGMVEVMPNGTDMEIPDRAKYLKMRHRGLEEVGVKSDSFVLLFVGQHRWEKNVKCILDACKILKVRNEPFKMVFVGEGYAEKDMRKMARNYGLDEEVKFMGVITDRVRLSRLYASADLFVFPSLYDNAPLVIREAAAFDLPSVVVRNTSSSEGLMDNVNGYLVDNAGEALAARITEIKKNPEGLRKVGEGARRSIFRNWESIVDDVAQRYETIVANHSKNAAKKNPKRSKKGPRT